MHAMKVSVYLFPLNSRENPRLLWLLTAASSSDVMGGVICIVVGGEGVVMHGRVVKPVYSCPPPPPSWSWQEVACYKYTGPNTC